MQHKYRLVIFDWDGTLINSFERIITCYREMFREVSLPCPGDQEIKETIGLPMDPSIDLLYPGLDASQRQSMVAVYRDIWRGDKIPPSPLFSGSMALMDWMSQGGSILAVATGKSREGMEREARSHEVYHHFHHSRCALEGHAKPHPQMLNEIMVEAGVGPLDTLMIGDHVLDLEMARSAGVDAIGVTSGGISAERLEACSPLTVLGTVAEVRGFLETIN